ncbi:MAG: hypothetical protein QG616_2072 [Pseudomonadota bacterium]|nr:hypothetical protein [Pseudomonadota bacterium]
MSKELTHKKKLTWMAEWCAKHKLALDLSGEAGFGRECVGVSANDTWPDYEWHDDSTYERLDNNGEVWTPPDAYHKHPCVAVLGRGKKAEGQLYDWLKWFDNNGFAVEQGTQAVDPKLGAIAYLMGKHKYVRMVKP